MSKIIYEVYQNDIKKAEFVNVKSLLSGNTNEDDDSQAPNNTGGSTTGDDEGDGN